MNHHEVKYAVVIDPPSLEKVEVLSLRSFGEAVQIVRDLAAAMEIGTYSDEMLVAAVRALEWVKANPPA